MVDVTGWLTLGGLFTAHITGNLAVIAAATVDGDAILPSQLLAVPVFYSFFDDVAQSRVFARVWARAAAPFAWARRRAATATQTFLGMIGRH